MTTNAFDQELRRIQTAGLVDAQAIERRARALQAQFLRDKLAGAFRALGSLAGRAQTYLERRRALARLHQLDDRLLADIGLSRGNLLSELLEAEAAQAAAAHHEATPVVGSAADVRPAANVNRPARAA